tara:strand:+ start:7212 stop:7697 length:486 start_codon:yes stop_codon:yes gene_type:complete
MGDFSKEDILMFYGFILARIILLKLSTSITSNIMSQIYTERVLINGDEPPPLRNTVFLFIIIDSIFNILLLGGIGLIDKYNDTQEDGIFRFAKLFVIQYLSSMVIIVILSLIISNTMYNKKYFLYKDDGLRAIRALEELIVRNGILVTLIPFFLSFLTNNG